MATPIHKCDICQTRGSYKDAVICCIECDERLCSSCAEHHGISKATKLHTTQSIDDYDNLPNFVLTSKDHCNEHDSKYELFCVSHDDFCCVQCISEKHKDCDQLSPISAVVHNIKNSAFMTHIEKMTEQLLKHSELLMKKSQNSTETLTVTMEKCKVEIKELRQTIEVHLRKVEKQILEDLECKYKQCMQIKETIQKDIETASERVKNISRDLTNIKKHASETQTFTGLREIERVLYKDKTFLNTLPTEGTLKDSVCKFEISPAIFYITSDLTLLGQISIDEKVMDLSHDIVHRNEAQMIKSFKRGIQQYNVKNSATFKISTGKNPLRVTGCTTMSSGSLVFADKNNDRVVILESTGKFLREIAISGSPVDVCYMSKNQAVISLANKTKLKIINIESGSTVRKHMLTSTGYGVFVSGDSVVVRIKDFGFLIMNIVTNSKKMVYVAGDCILYVSYKNERLYYTKWDEHKLVCCDLTGTIVWEFTNEVLKKPCGLSVTCDGNLFVAGFESNNVLLISADGKTFRQIVKGAESLNNPTAIHYSSEWKQLLVANLNDSICTVFRFD